MSPHGCSLRILLSVHGFPQLSANMPDKNKQASRSEPKPPGVSLPFSFLPISEKPRLFVKSNRDDDALPSNLPLFLQIRLVRTDNRRFFGACDSDRGGPRPSAPPSPPASTSGPLVPGFDSRQPPLQARRTAGQLPDGRPQRPPHSGHRVHVATEIDHTSAELASRDGRRPSLMMGWSGRTKSHTHTVSYVVAAIIQDMARTRTVKTHTHTHTLSPVYKTKCR